MIKKLYEKRFEVIISIWIIAIPLTFLAPIYTKFYFIYLLCGLLFSSFLLFIEDIFKNGV